MRRRMIGFAAAVMAVLVLSACGGSSSTSSSSSTPTTTTTTTAAPTSSVAQGSPNGLSYEGIPLQVGPFIAPADTTGTTPVDGIRCAPVEQLAYHIHAHLAVFDSGRLYALPAGIGIPGSTTEQTTEGPVATAGQCFYWLHTHTSDGVIHIESPTQRVYTLGQFFDEWHQPLTANRVGTLHGRIAAFFNGKPWTKNIRAIPLLPHALIQFDIGEPTPPLVHISWAHTGL